MGDIAAMQHKVDAMLETSTPVTMPTDEVGRINDLSQAGSQEKSTFNQQILAIQELFQIESSSWKQANDALRKDLHDAEERAMLQSTPMHEAIQSAFESLARMQEETETLGQCMIAMRDELTSSVESVRGEMKSSVEAVWKQLRTTVREEFQVILLDDESFAKASQPPDNSGDKAKTLGDKRSSPRKQNRHGAPTLETVQEEGSTAFREDGE